MRLNPFARQHVVLWTRLTPEACRERLAQVVMGVREQMGWSPLMMGSLKPFAGSVSTRGFRVRVYRASIRNSFQTHAHGRFRATPHGTRVEVALGVHWTVIAFMIVWFGAVLLWGIVATARFVVAPGDSAPTPVLLLLALGFVAVGAAIVRAGRRFARDESAIIVQTLCYVLEAEEIRDV